MKEKKIKIGIIGGAGYTAGELIRLLINHPNAEITFIHSVSNPGNPITDIHEGLIGECDLKFTDELPLNKTDLIFICSGHGNSKKFIESHDIPANLSIIDLSQDYRIEAEGNDFIYGLPEMQKGEIEGCKHIANPGCFATAIQMTLLPLANAGLIKDDIHVNAITGSTGAGVKPGPTKHFSWRNNNISVYKPFVHQHLYEINQSIKNLQKGFNKEIIFLPVRGDFPRGIFVSMYTKFEGTEEEAVNLFKSYYKNAAFTFVTDKNLDLKQVVNTNKCIVHVEKHEDKILVLSAIDNLLKGAVGQAVQNMNLMFSLPEKTGLNLKASAF